MEIKRLTGLERHNETAAPMDLVSGDALEQRVGRKSGDFKTTKCSNNPPETENTTSEVHKIIENMKAMVTGGTKAIRESRIN